MQAPQTLIFGSKSNKTGRNILLTLTRLPVLLMWTGHNKIIDKLCKFNHWITLLNGLVLLFVVLFPYPTRLAGSFIGTPAQETAVAVYSGFTGFITLSLFLLNLYISK